jgi:tetratricopeptide (TPR) repeat protein
MRKLNPHLLTMYNRKILNRFLFIALLLMAGAHLTGQVKIWEEMISLPTYEPKPPDKNPMFYVPDAYQGAKRVLYPYPLMDNLSSESKEKEHKAIYLENEYIKLCLLPDIGGRLFYAIDKTNDYDIFYRQHVIKPANIGMLGAWISGGIEWCVFHHHRASTYLPVDYRLMENEDGSKTIWFGEIEPRHRMKWSIGLTLHPGRSYIETDVRMYNRTEHTHSILYWANVATHVNDDYQVFFPPSVTQGVYHAKNSFIHWPVSDEVYNGKDYTGQVDVNWWKNHPEPISIFAYDLKEDFMGGYDHSKNAGTVHVGNHHIVKGAKLWEWGPGEYGHMWDCEILTDEDGPYAEIMVGGFSDNQPDYSWIKPGEVKSLKQYWYPAREIGGFKNANLDAVVNLEFQGENQVKIGLNTTRQHNYATVVLLKEETKLFEEQISIGPENPFVREIEIGQNSTITDLKVVLLDQKNNELISYQETERTYDPSLPETVKPPEKPEEIEQIEELVLTGQRIMQFHNPGLDPADYFNEAVHRDPLHSLANMHLGNLAAKAGKYEEAATRYRNSIQRITRDYTRPRDCEALYRLGVVLKKQKKYAAAVDTLYRASWDQAYFAASHFELAGISVSQGKYAEALDHLNQTLLLNALNPEAHGMKSAVLRHLGDRISATVESRRAWEIDPLDHMAAYELMLLDDIFPAAFTELLNDNKENYLELTTEYLNSGFFEEALGVLEFALTSENSSLHSYPLLHYYYAYLNEILGEKAIADTFYESAASLSTDYVFPFRFETLEILDAAIRHNPDDAKAWYYKGNILYDHQPEGAVKCWKRSISLDQSLSIAQRNLGWAHYRHAGEIGEAIDYYEKAISNNPLEARYYYELDLLYEKNNVDLVKRYQMLTENHETVIYRDDAYVREIEVLLLNKQYDKAIEHLSSHTFQRQEGVVNLHELFVDAHILKGRELLTDGLYDQALEQFLLADTYPENHMIGRISTYSKEAQVYYFTGMAYRGLKKNSYATKFFTKAVQVPVGDSEYLYYQSLSYGELDDENAANTAKNKLLKVGQEALNNASESDFFAKFGEGMSVKERKAEATFKLALGYKAAGQTDQASKALEQALALKNSILWANVYHESILAK